MVLAPLVASASEIQIAHQGRLLDSTGVVINGTVSLTVSLWTDATSTGTTDPKCTGTFASVSVENGYYSLVLGSETPLPSAVLGNPALYVQLKVGSADPLAPRQFLYSVPNAQVAARVRSVSTPSGSRSDEGAL